MADLKTIKGLALKIGATRLHLAVLRGVSVFWPVSLLGSVFLVAALAGAFDEADPFAAALATLLILILGGIFIWRGVRRYRYPDEHDARRALDRGSDLRPIASLTDRPVEITEAGQTLWQAHMQRLRIAAERLPLPRFGALWRGVDPYYLRAVLPLVLVIGFYGAGGEGPGRLMRALFPDYGVLIGADDVRIEAWITAPDHTRKPPVFLTSNEEADGNFEAVRVPAGSEVTLRAQARSAPKLVLRGLTKRRRLGFEETPDGAYEIKAIITEDTELSVNWWGRRAGGTILASPDGLPKAEFVQVPSLGPNDQTLFSWKVSDDYGVARLELALRLVEPHPAAPDDERREPIELPGPLMEEASEEAALDLTRHPWAGLMVEGRLVATDGGGNEGVSAPYEFVLPEKLLLQTLARAVQEARVTVLREPRDYGEVGVMNRLNAAPEGVQRAAFMLDAMTYEPYRFFGDYEAFLGLSTARGMLKAARSIEEAAETDGLLWAIALKAEYGSAADALAALLAAKKALERALRDGASEEEIARLTDAFRQAAENYVQAKLAEAIANGLPEGAQEEGLDNQQAGGGPSLGQNSFEEMLDALEDLTSTGATDQARQLLSDISNLLENLEFQQGNGSGGDGFSLPSEGGEGKDGEQSQAEQELADDLEELSEALREQRELNDDTLEARRNERDQARRDRNGQQGSPSGGEGEESQAGETLEELAERQAEIGELLRQLAENEAAGRGEQEGETGGAGDEPGEEQQGGGGADGEERPQNGSGGLGADGLEGVQRAQRRAEDALRNGEFARAQRNQERIVEGLRALADGLVTELDDLRAEDGGGQETDPFGNSIGTPGASDEVNVPDKSERQRALDILEELRRRYSEATDPEEREYLKRLLDRF